MYDLNECVSCMLKTSSNSYKMYEERDSQEHCHRFAVDDLCEFNRSVCGCIIVACNAFVCVSLRFLSFTSHVYVTADTSAVMSWILFAIHLSIKISFSYEIAFGSRWIHKAVCFVVFEWPFVYSLILFSSFVVVTRIKAQNSDFYSGWNFRWHFFFFVCGMNRSQTKISSDIATDSSCVCSRWLSNRHAKIAYTLSFILRYSNSHINLNSIHL